jgi:hypothetical protein
MDQGIVNIGTSVVNQLIAALNKVIDFLPQLIAGIILLIIGWIIAAILRSLTRRLLRAINISHWFDRAGIKSSHNTWITIISQLVFWSVFILFLIPVFDTFNLRQINQLLNEIILYIPSVIAAVIVSFIGIIFGNLLAEIVKNATTSYGAQVGNVLSAVSKYSIIIFTALIVLNLLGIAPVLIQIFLTGLMLAFALAVGLAFGLGGKDFASELFNRLMGGNLKK